MFSKLRSQYQAREVASQALLFPVTLQLSSDEIELLEQHGSEIRAMGLEVRVRGRDMVSVHSVPRLLQRGSAERLLGDLLTELSRTGARGFSDAVDKALATMACHAAVRAGDVVGRDEAVALLAALEGTDFASYCPHGRPIVAFLSWAELERRVGRR
jgi:DNA mismatch repair protein MutL